MPQLQSYQRIDRSIRRTLSRYGERLLRWSVAIVFIWFGLLKPLGYSEAAPLMTALVDRLLWWAISPGLFIDVVGWWEVLIGVCLLFRRLMRAALFLLALQMVGTMSPLLVLPARCFQPGGIPWAPTLEGQYIVKNIVIISAAMVIGGNVQRHSRHRKLL